MVRAVNGPPSLFQPRRCGRLSSNCKMSGKQSKPAMTGPRSMDIWPPFLNWSNGGTQEGKAVNRAHRALHLRGHKSVREPEPFAAVILCTSDQGKGR